MWHEMSLCQILWHLFRGIYLNQHLVLLVVSASFHGILGRAVHSASSCFALTTDMKQGCLQLVLIFLSRNVELTLFMLSFYFKQIFSVDSTLKEL